MPWNVFGPDRATGFPFFDMPPGRVILYISFGLHKGPSMLTVPMPLNSSWPKMKTEPWL